MRGWIAVFNLIVVALLSIQANAQQSYRDDAYRWGMEFPQGWKRAEPQNVPPSTPSPRTVVRFVPESSTDEFPFIAVEVHEFDVNSLLAFSDPVQRDSILESRNLDLNARIAKHLRKDVLQDNQSVYKLRVVVFGRQSKVVLTHQSVGMPPSEAEAKEFFGVCETVGFDLGFDLPSSEFQERKAAIANLMNPPTKIPWGKVIIKIGLTLAAVVCVIVFAKKKAKVN